jgi:uncharacterized protein involved in outer membrane biogenesis
MFKKLLKIGAVLIVLLLIALGAGVYWLMNNLNWVVRSQTEKAMSYALMVPVTIGGAEVNLREQWVELRDIDIANPEGYKTSHAMRFGVVRVQIDAASFRTTEPRIRLIRIVESDISFERTLRSSNLQDLMDNVSRLIDEDAPPPDPEINLIIEQMIVENTTVRLTLPIASTVATAKGNASLSVSDIVIENFGGGESMSPAEGMQMFIAVILKTILENAGDILSAETLASLNATLQDVPGEVAGRAEAAAESVGSVAKEVSDELKQTLGNLGDTVGDAAKGVGETVEDAAEEVRQGLGRLLPGRRSQDSSTEE